MSKCKNCAKEMLKINSCDFNCIQINGKHYKRNTKYHDINKRCHDCNIINGKIHHFGCDIERCPRCKGQLLSCECKKEFLFKDI